MIEVLRRQSRAVHSGAYGSADSSHPPESFIGGGEVRGGGGGGCW